MARSFADIAFTPAVRTFQSRMGSRRNYAPLDDIEDRGVELTDRETDFIAERDGFYQATVGETGWPYVQFRGGAEGFLKVLDANTIGYADFRGNVQYISAGNLSHDGRIALILMDYAQRRRLKLWGRARLVDVRDDASLVERLEVPSYRARVERAVIITVEAFDWNCPQHITPRYTDAEVEAATANLRGEVARLRAEVDRLRTQRTVPDTLGEGPLALVVAGVNELTPRIRAYTLRAADGVELPPVTAGAHVDLPVPLAGGRVATRRYSIASDPARRDAWEFAVLREDGGSGGSAAVHAHYRVGLRLNAALPGNDFRLVNDARPAVLIAGGIGITPIRAMAHALRASGRNFTLHYAARSRDDMAWGAELAREFGPQLTTYASDAGTRLNIDLLLRTSPPDARIYVCGPARLVDAVSKSAARHGAANRIVSERFTPDRRSADSPFVVELRRSGRRVDVPADRTILEAVEAAGVSAPSSCRSGNCATCATKVLDGTPEHRDTALSDVERDGAGLMCICVSRAHTPSLALEL
jgi:ferredoxin-NADP reductase/predicted pyridoxine 5'-phosphate oxidase superfamily flavin-nucleotide-binding protein